MLEKLEYYICLFLYGLKEKEQVSKNSKRQILRLPLNLTPLL